MRAASIGHSAHFRGSCVLVSSAVRSRPRGKVFLRWAAPDLAEAGPCDRALRRPPASRLIGNTRAVMRWLALAGVLAGIAVGCGGNSPGAHRPTTKVFELADYPFEREGYLGTGSSIREIEPDTLEPVTRRGLRLGAYVNRFTFSPD